jgi:ribosomal protein L3
MWVLFYHSQRWLKHYRLQSHLQVKRMQGSAGNNSTAAAALAASAAPGAAGCESKPHHNSYVEHIIRRLRHHCSCT